MKRLRWTTFALLLVFAFVGQTMAASLTLTPTHDTTADPLNPTQNRNGDSLSLAYSSFDGADFRATQTIFLQFDLSAVDESLNRSALTLTIFENALLADDADVALYSVADDWTADDLTAANAPSLSSPLATANVMPDSLEIIFGSQTNASAFASQLESERQGDGIASFALRIDAATNGRFGGALVMADSESGIGPEIAVGQGVPTAVGLSSAEILPLSNLALLLAFLLLLPTIYHVGAMQTRPTFHWQQRLPRLSRPVFGDRQEGRDKRRNRHTWLKLFAVYLAPTVLVGLAILNVRGAQAQTCDAVTPELTIYAFNGKDAELNWTDDPANKLGYKIWRTFDDMPISTEDAPYKTLPAGSNQFIDVDAIKDDGTVINYLIVGVSSCGDSQPSPVYGVKQFALNINNGAYNFITIPFESGIQSAFDLYSTVYGAKAVMKWDAEKGAFRIFVPPFGGDNFLIEPGDTLLIAAGDGMLPNITFTGEQVAREYEMSEGAPNLAALPMQVEGVDSAETLLSQTAEFKSVKRWNPTSQQFEAYSPDKRAFNFPIRPFDPLVLQLNLPDLQNFFLWPEDDGLVVWSEREVNGQREVYVHWQDGEYSADSQYNVIRRPLVGNDPEVVFNVKRGAFTDFVQLVPVDVMNDLKAETGADSDQHLFDLLAADDNLVRLIATRHHEIAIVFGLGFLDTDPLAGAAAYAVVPVNGDGRIGEACTYLANHYAPLNLRETMPFAVPDGLGVRPSPRPFNAAERFDWGSSQQWRTQDGRVYLDWDVAADEQNPVRCAGHEQERLAGYHVYRNGLMTNGMEPFEATASGNPTLITTGSLAENDPNRDDDDFLIEGAEPYLLEDDIKSNFPDLPLQNVYVAVDYRVCKVDYLGEEHACELLSKVPVRELTPPLPPTDVIASMNEAHTVLTLDWEHDTTGEASEPVRYYVSYSEDPHLPADQWQELIPGGLQNTAVAFGNPLNERNVTLFYRVQARDNAGNWSAVSSPASAMFADRTPPQAPDIEGTDDCETGRLPVEMNLNDDDVVGVRVYRQLLRGTTPLSPSQYITTVPVIDGTATFDEENYEPPVNVSVRYTFQAVDGNGNQSEVSDHCVLLGSGEQPLPPPVIIDIDPKIASGKTIIIVPRDGGDDLPPGLRVRVWVPGYDEPFEGTVNPDGSITYDDPNAEQIINDALEYGVVRVEVFVVDPFGVEGEPEDEILGRGNPDDFERGYTHLGALKLVEWIEPEQGDPYVRVQITDKLPCTECDDYPYIALFRRAADANWLQVSSFVDMATLVNNIGIGMVIEDRGDLSHNESYEYKVVAFGKRKMEMVGVWETWTLPPLDATEYSFDMGGAMGDTPDDHACAKVAESPTFAGLPPEIIGPNGWTIIVVEYWKDGGDGCYAIDFSADNVSGVGKLITPSSGHLFNFDGWKLDPTNGKLLAGGTIIETTGYLAGLASSSILNVTRLELNEATSSAEFTLTLPTNALFTPAPNKRGNTLFGVLSNFTFDHNFTELVRDDLMMVDENLPWLFEPNETAITPNGVEMRGIKVTYRIPEPVQPEQNGVIVADNNLGFMAAGYEAALAIVDKHGVSGTFGTGEAGSYSTSLPAAFAINFNGASVELNDGNIADGQLDNVSIEFEYMPNHIEFEYVQPNRDFRPPILRREVVNDDLTLERLAIATADDKLDVGEFGRLHRSVVTQSQPKWLSFTSLHPEAELLIAPASVNTDPELYVWEMVGENDPGLNFTRIEDLNDADTLGYSCFETSDFDAALDLYLRRGGVSRTFVLTPDVRLDRTMNDFVVKIEGMNAAFLDNYMRGELMMELLLPYPSDISIDQMVVDEFDVGGCPAAGRTDPKMVYHGYWDLQHYLHGDFEFADATPELYGNVPYAQLVQFDGTLLVKGMSYHGSTSEEVYVPARTTWFPNGDAGKSKIMDSESHWLEASRADAPIEVTFPFTPTGHINGLEHVLENVIIAPRYSDQADANSLPNMLGLDVEAMLDVYGLDSGVISAEILNACAQLEQDGCGFLVVDGEMAVDMLGELLPDAVNDEIDAAYRATGGSPTALLNYAGTKIKNFITDPGIEWDWRTSKHNVLDEHYGMQLQVHPDGGALVGVFKEFNFLEEAHGLSLLSGDIGYAITFDFDEVDTIDDIGIFVGYAAVPGAVRALAMNMPDFDSPAATRPYENYADISDDVDDWLAVFHYDDLLPNHDDCNANQQTPQQLIQSMWGDWATDGISETFRLVEPRIDGFEGRRCYGLAPLQSGELLQDVAFTRFKGIAGQLIISTDGLFDFTFEEVAMGTHYRTTIPEDTILLEADWLGASYNRDSVLHLYGDDVQSDLLGLSLLPDDFRTSASFDIQLKFDDDNDVERMEGGVEVQNLELIVLSFPRISGVYGSGDYTLENDETVKIDYFGADVEGVLRIFGDSPIDVGSYPLGGRFLMGEINVSNDSPLAEFGFGDLLGKFGNADPNAPNVREGWYVDVYGTFPLLEIGILEVSAGAEIAVWDFESSRGSSTGGTIIGSAHAKLAYILSGKGALELTMEQLAPNDSINTGWGGSLDQTCQPDDGYDDCFAFSGEFWIASGAGWCSPRTWRHWNRRWWGDSWCYQVGAVVGMSYLDEGNSSNWEADYDVDWE